MLVSDWPKLHCLIYKIKFFNLIRKINIIFSNNLSPTLGIHHHFITFSQTLAPEPVFAVNLTLLPLHCNSHPLTIASLFRSPHTYSRGLTSLLSLSLHSIFLSSSFTPFSTMAFILLYSRLYLVDLLLTYCR